MRNFFKLTFFKLVTFFAIIFLFIVGRRLSVSSDVPSETLFSKFDHVIFAPVSFVSNLTGSFSVVFNFILRHLVYYVMACLLVFVIKFTLGKISKNT